MRIKNYILRSANAALTYILYHINSGNITALVSTSDESVRWFPQVYKLPL